MTLRDEFWVKLKLEKLPLKIIFSKYFFHLLNPLKVTVTVQFSLKIIHEFLSSNLENSIFSDQRFYITWFRIPWHMGIFRVKIYSRIQKYQNILNPSIQFFKNAFFSKMRRRKSKRSPVKSILRRREVIQNSGNVANSK